MNGAVQTVGPVVFDYRWFQQRYSDLAEWVSPEMAQGYFDLATLYLDNSDAGGVPQVIPGYGTTGCYAPGSPVRNIPQRQILLGLLTAHFAALNAPLNGQASSGGVGRIASASEGSVSVSFDLPSMPGAEFFSLTKYGLQFWQATARYRMGRYFPGPQRVGYGFRGGRGAW